MIKTLKNIASHLNSTKGFVVDYITSCFDLIEQGRRLQNVLNRQELDFAIVADMEVKIIAADEKGKLQQLDTDTILVQQDKPVRMLTKQTQGFINAQTNLNKLETLAQDTLIVTKQNELYFYDANINKLVYFSNPKDINLASSFLPLLSYGKIDKNKKEKNKLNSAELKTKFTNHNINQINEKDINKCVNYLLHNSSYSLLLIKMFLIIVSYIVGVIAVAGAIYFLTTGAVIAGLIVAIAAPITSGILALSCLIDGIKNKDISAFISVSLHIFIGIGFLLTGLAAILSPTAPVLLIIGWSLVAIGLGGKGIILLITNHKSIFNAIGKIIDGAHEAIKKLKATWKRILLIFAAILICLALGATAIVLTIIFPLSTVVLYFGICLAIAMMLTIVAGSIFVLAKNPVINFCKSIVGKITAGTKRSYKELKSKTKNIGIKDRSPRTYVKLAMLHATSKTNTAKGTIFKLTTTLASILGAAYYMLHAHHPVHDSVIFSTGLVGYYLFAHRKTKKNGAQFFECKKPEATTNVDDNAQKPVATKLDAAGKEINTKQQEEPKLEKKQPQGKTLITVLLVLLFGFLYV